jgi:ribonuclease G
LDRELLIAAGPGEWRAALLERGVAVELYVERGCGCEAGSIHLGRVRRLVPGLGAVLVDIGGDRPAFLPQSEIVPRGRRLHDGERVVVQIRREAQGGKAARVTMAVAPGAPFLTRAAIAVGGDAGDEDDALAQRRREIADRAARLEPPARLDPPASFAAALAAALPGMPGRIRVDDPAALAELRAAFPDSAVEPVAEPEWPIELDEVFAEALSETLALPGGGSAHFEATRAGVMIDIDSGTPEGGAPQRTALAVNLAAAGAIARQLRLRNLGGGIVVDFVGLDSRRARERVRAALAKALMPDPAGPQILGWTRLGHLELVRPRRGRPLAETLLEALPGGGRVKTPLTVAHEALRALRREARARPGRQWRLAVAPDVAAALAEAAAAAVAEAERRFASRIVIETDPACRRERFQISVL